MLDFPASPALNDKYRDWKYDGEKWAAPAVPGEPPSDGCAYGLKNGVWVPTIWRQRIDLSGLNSKDVPVPAGAKMMRWMIGPQQVGTTNECIMMRLSTDGTTFWSGATNYGVGAYLHGNSPNTYVKQIPFYSGAGFYLTWTHNNANYSQLSRGFMTLVVPNVASKCFTSKFSAENFNASYAGLLTIGHNWTNGLTGASNAIQALRIYMVGGSVFAANQQIAVEWIS
jgi:hypothetical protein